MIWVALYLILISIITFIVFGADKQRARKKEWRIPEKVLFFLAIIGGSVGAILGMLIFHHKTRKWYFKIGMPVILIIQITAFVLVWRYLL